MADLIPGNGEQFNENVKKPEAANSLDISKKGIKLFFGEKERQLLLSLGSELIIDQLQESFLLYRIDYRTTKTHALYGEAIQKNYLPEIEIFGRINVESDGPEYMVPGGLIRYGYGRITAHVYIHHLQELEAEIRMGDFIYHKGNFYEIIDDGKANISNQHAFGGDKFFYITIKGVEVNSDVFKAR
jgi:hypothetical protein